MLWRAAVRALAAALVLVLLAQGWHRGQMLVPLAQSLPVVVCAAAIGAHRTWLWLALAMLMYFMYYGARVWPYWAALDIAGLALAVAVFAACLARPASTQITED